MFVVLMPVGYLTSLTEMMCQNDILFGSPITSTISPNLIMSFTLAFQSEFRLLLETLLFHGGDVLGRPIFHHRRPSDPPVSTILDVDSKPSSPTMEKEHIKEYKYDLQKNIDSPRDPFPSFGLRSPSALRTFITSASVCRSDVSTSHLEPAP